MKHRREVRVLHLFTYLVIPILISVAMWTLFGILGNRFSDHIRYILLIVCILASYFLLKRIIIGAVLAYKAFAPMSVRSQCRFEPTCSTYMVMAINKYGLFRGIYKGIRRILRCRPPNGGVDYP